MGIGQVNAPLRALLPSTNRRRALERSERAELLGAQTDRRRCEILLITELWLLSGKTVSVCRDGTYGNTMVNYRETLPEGLAPLVVLDASGRVRSTYDQWEENRGGLTRLAAAPKRYDNLTVHCWRTNGGKSAFKQNGRTLLDGIAATINTKPNEEWLVVFHKEFKAEIEKRFADNKRVHLIHWGEHQATNDYTAVPNVILAGTLFYRPSYYEALTRLVVDRRPVQGGIDPAMEKGVTIGEHRHLVLQALCRGSVRKCQGDMCTPCNVYIIAATRSGIPETLPRIFPGCRVVSWQPVQKALRGKVKEAAEFVIDWFEKNPEDLLRFNVVQRVIGIESASNFRQDIRRHNDFKEALAAHDIAEAQVLGDNRRGFLRPAFD
jgi:hypothetical protein